MYTPGEWRAKATDEGHWLIVCNKGLIADVYNHIEGYEANAQLIAAAPDMYEALKAIIENRDVTRDHHVNKFFEAGQKVARAVAKAEGK